jgi:hypothetical protein
MALKLTKTTETGFESKDAYHKIDWLIIKNKTQINFVVKSYKDIKYIPFAENSYICDYDLNGENPIKQAYLHLKTLPEFADAVDC